MGNPILLLITLGGYCHAQKAIKKNKKPNILVIWGDDIGESNISAYSHGIMGYQTPNIDRVANEGLMFTDYYAEQSCTAGRSTFILGQSVFRTGLAKVGVPQGKEGISEDDPTIAELLKNQGYVTGQFGKNHLGDRDEHLPTNHGFDEFFGNLYHLNAEEDPENFDYPDPEKYPTFRANYGPRDVIHSWAKNTNIKRADDIRGFITKNSKIDTITENQIIVETGPLNKKRMETIDDETIDAAKRFITNAVEKGERFFVWWNGTRMHFRTHVKEELIGISGQDEYSDGMVEHDMHVGVLLNLLDSLGIADNTLVHYGTDNGAHKNTWPDAGTNPFRGEKNTNWEGGYRVPSLVRWPGQIKAGSISNEIVSGMDWMPTFLAAAGADVEDIKKQLKSKVTGYRANGRTFKNVHLDGFNILEHLKDPSKPSGRNQFFYINDGGEFTAIRYDDWKLILMEQRSKGTMEVWANPFTPLRVPLIFHLRRDPYEFATVTSNTYYDWQLERMFLIYPAAGGIKQFVKTFADIPQDEFKKAKKILNKAEVKLDKCKSELKKDRLPLLAAVEDAQHELDKMRRAKERMEKLRETIERLETFANH